MTEPLRILACNWRCLRHPEAGGAEINLFEQARRWVRDGHQVTVVSADPGRDAAPDKHEIIDGIEVRRMGGRFSVYALVALFVLRHGHEFDVVLDVANGIPFFTPLWTRRPVTLLVHHVHGAQWFSEFAPPVALFGRFLERHVVPFLYANTRIVAVSPTTRDALVAEGIERERVHVIYNGIAGTESAVPAPTTHDARRIVYVGRLKRYKRLDHLIRAVADLRTEFPDIRLDIAGDGDARPALEELVASLGLEAYVTLHGFTAAAQKDALLRAAAVFATPSMHEGWGLSVLEANAQGCPAVAYDVPGLRVAIRHEETGLLAAPDEGAFRMSIGRFLRDASFRALCSAGAVRWAARFDWEQCARETLAVLQANPHPGRAALGSIAR
jgi:glycosyltransferase involved in cell wall biosynthesis